MDSRALARVVHGQQEGSSRDSKMKTSSKQSVKATDTVEKSCKKAEEEWTQAQGVSSHRVRQE
jgi:hypothetical protein